MGDMVEGGNRGARIPVTATSCHAWLHCSPSPGLAAGQCLERKFLSTLTLSVGVNHRAGAV